MPGTTLLEQVQHEQYSERARASCALVHVGVCDLTDGKGARHLSPLPARSLMLERNESVFGAVE